MQAMMRAVLRLVLMVLVMAGVLVTATAIGLPVTAVLGLSITLAGLCGMVGLARRGAASRRSTAGADRASIDVTAPEDQPRPVDHAERTAASVDPVAAEMAPGATADPESLMPRWRRPSLLAARQADPLRVGRLDRAPMRFGPAADPSPNRRVVRYAMVTLLDRPDEVLGHEVSDLIPGDEVEVLDTASSFWEVLCPDGLRGWVHRTTLSMPGAEHRSLGRREPMPEPDDILTAVLSARGIR
jgi:hypothetical protein